MAKKKTDFDAFVNACRRYQEAFGLIGWELFFEQKKLDEANARVAWNADSRVAVVTLNEDAELDAHGRAGVERYARHEMLHLLLADAEYGVSSRHMPREQVEREFEKVVVKLTHLLS